MGPIRELERVFNFIVKNSVEAIPWTNKEIRRMIRWAWYYNKLLIVYSPAAKGTQRIAACCLAWRTQKPNVNFSGMTLDIDNTEFGDFLCILYACVHPEFEKKGLLFMLLTMTLYRFPGVHTAFWLTRRDKMATISIAKLISTLGKGALKSCQVEDQDQASQIYSPRLSVN